MPLNVSEFGLSIRRQPHKLLGCLLIDSWSCVHLLYAGKNCNGNPISTFPPSYVFQMIFTALDPRLIQSISRNVGNKNEALKRLCRGWTDFHLTIWIQCKAISILPRRSI